MGFLQPYGRVRPDFTYTCGSFQSAYSTGEEIRAHSGGEATMSFCEGMKQPLADLQLLQPRRKRLQVSRSYGTPLKTPSMLEGDVTQEQTTKHIKHVVYFLFEKKVSENWGTLWGWLKRTQTQYMVAVGKDELIWAGYLHHKQDSKELEFLVWHLWAGLEWDTAPRANPVHSGRSMYRTLAKWQYQGQMSESTAPRKEMCHSGEPVPNGTNKFVYWTFIIQKNGN